MGELPLEDLQAQLQAHLNGVELCRALYKQTSDPYVREALKPLVDELQECVASLAGYLRGQGAAIGSLELDGPGKARIRDLLGRRALSEQLGIVHECLAELAAWYAGHPGAEQAEQRVPDWLETLSAQAGHILARWEQHMREMKAIQ